MRHRTPVASASCIRRTAPSDLMAHVVPAGSLRFKLAVARTTRGPAEQGTGPGVKEPESERYSDSGFLCERVVYGLRVSQKLQPRANLPACNRIGEDGCLGEFCSRWSPN